MPQSLPPSRRAFLARATTLTSALWLQPFLPRYARASEGHSPGLAGPVGPIHLQIDTASPLIDGRVGKAITVNGSLPGPLIRLQEGQMADLRVSNALRADSSIHWHGLILPQDMDGVPGVSFAGIAPGETFEYRFPVSQSGTYWYHSHSGLQEQQGVFGPLVIDPIEPEPFEADREHVVMLSDWTFMDPMKVMGMLKKSAGAYNFQRRTVGDVLSRKDGMSLQDTAPYWFDIEVYGYVSHLLDVSFRFAASYELLFTQRLIGQFRFETNVAIQEVEEFGVGRGWNDVDLGFRLRFEINRQFAPYLGVSWNQRLFETAALAKREGESPTSLVGLAGLRFWF